MKYNNKFTIFTLFALSMLLISCGTSQSVLEKAEKARLLDEQIENLDFKFTANHVYPQSYQSIHLSSSYDVTITSDTVKAYLPYFGRAYRAPMNSSEGGIKFESIDFESKVQVGKRYGEWHVTIETKDTSRPFTLYFHLWNNGAARLNVIDRDRQSISFQGSIEENKKEE
ncbi:MAG: DUF4251 domain-containing protein [Bacteroidales bacterium]|nr:DUF4251 domain-containing protein [Bacteroidales bacterium]